MSLEKLTALKEKITSQNKIKEQDEARSELKLWYQDIEAQHNLLLAGLKDNYPMLKLGQNGSIIYYQDAAGQVIEADQLDSYPRDIKELSVGNEFVIQITDLIFLVIENVGRVQSLAHPLFNGVYIGVGTLFKTSLNLKEFSEHCFVRLTEYLEEAHDYINHQSEIDSWAKETEAKAQQHQEALADRIKEFYDKIRKRNMFLLDSYAPKAAMEFPFSLYECRWQCGFGIDEGETYFDYQQELTHCDRLEDGYFTTIKGARIAPSPNSSPQFSEKQYQGLSELPNALTKVVEIPQVKMAGGRVRLEVKQFRNSAKYSKHKIHFDDFEVEVQFTNGHFDIYYLDDSELEAYAEEFKDILPKNEEWFYSYKRKFLTIRVPNEKLLKYGQEPSPARSVRCMVEE